MSSTRGQPMREMIIQLDVESADRRWQERANCLGVDPDLFFPERGASTKDAKGVCGGCEVKTDALESAVGWRVGGRGHAGGEAGRPGRGGGARAAGRRRHGRGGARG